MRNFSLIIPRTASGEDFLSQICDTIVKLGIKFCLQQQHQKLFKHGARDFFRQIFFNFQDSKKCLQMIKNLAEFRSFQHQVTSNNRVNIQVKHQVQSQHRITNQLKIK